MKLRFPDWPFKRKKVDPNLEYLRRAAKLPSVDKNGWAIHNPEPPQRLATPRPRIKLGLFEPPSSEQIIAAIEAHGIEEILAVAADYFAQRYINEMAVHVSTPHFLRASFKLRELRAELVNSATKNDEGPIEAPPLTTDDIV